MSDAPLLAADYLTLGFAIAVGGVLGSFFNVLVHRWPRGKSIVSPGSCCPHCGAKIRARHNIPVLGWFLLRGACFDCGAPISPRYPFVEALTALAFGLIVWFEVICRGTNLPGTIAADGIDNLPNVADLWLSAGVHATLLSGLLVAAAIDYDGARLPKKWIVWLGVTIVAATLYRPGVLPAPAFSLVVEQLALNPWAIGLVSSIFGAIVGGVFGMLLAPATGLGPSGLRGRVTGVLVTAAVGAYLGWQAVGAIAMVTMLVYLQAIMYRFGWWKLQQVTYPMLLWLATLVWIPLWKTLVDRWPLGLRADHRILALEAGVVFVAAAVAYWFRGPQEVVRPPAAEETT